jgi:hypothetical protein
MMSRGNHLDEVAGDAVDSWNSSHVGNGHGVWSSAYHWSVSSTQPEVLIWCIPERKQPNSIPWSERSYSWAWDFLQVGRESGYERAKHTHSSQ